MERVKSAVTAIERDIRSQDQSLNIEDLWNTVREPRLDDVDEDLCRQTYYQVLKLAPVTPMRKDFEEGFRMNQIAKAMARATDPSPISSPHCPSSSANEQQIPQAILILNLPGRGEDRPQLTI